MFSKFLLGTIHIEENVQLVLGRTPLDMVARHAVCDFGHVSERVVKCNMEALSQGDAIVSEYPIDPLNKKLGVVRVTTEAGWANTHVTLVKKQPAQRKKKDGTTF